MKLKIPEVIIYIVGEKIDDLIQKAGGLKPGAFIEGAQFFRDGKRALIELGRAVKDNNSNDNFVLYPDDKLVIPKVDNFVNVKGAVIVPSKILYMKGKDASYYIEQTGGYKSEADKYETKIITPKGYIISAITPLWFNPEVPMGSAIEVPVKNN